MRGPRRAMASTKRTIVCARRPIGCSYRHGHRSVSHGVLVARQGDLSIVDTSMAKSSHSLIKSIIRLVQRPRSAVRAVWVRGARGKASCEYGRIACSRRRNCCSTWCVASSKRSPRLLARNERLDEASGSSGRNSLLHWSFCAVIWPHFAILNKLVSLWSLLTSRSGCQNAHIVPHGPRG